MKIAFCIDAQVFKQNQILDDELSKKYPGSLWVSMLVNSFQSKNVEVVTGDVAILNIYSKKWKADDILIIQNEDASDGILLEKMGAKPCVLTCLESPLFISRFYSHLKEISKKFPHRVLFRGALESLPDGDNHTLFFPSFSLKRNESNVNWSEKKFLVMVSGNKYWKTRRSIYRQFAAFLRDKILLKKSYLTKEIIRAQLHDQRLELVEYFGSKRVLDLYGPGWNNLSNLPREWEQRLKKVIEEIKPEPCDDKNEVISKYKFAICFENMSYPGYVTEKIIDCFIAGVIPIYLGSPDIEDFVPKDAFIDLRDFASCKALDIFLLSMKEEEAIKIIHSGRAFLKSKKGLKFSHEDFAANIARLVEEC